MTESVDTDDCPFPPFEKFEQQDPGLLKLGENQNKRVVHRIIPFNIKGVELDMLRKTVIKRNKKSGEQYRQESLFIPGTPYGRGQSTILVYSDRKGEHLTVLNRSGLHGNSINYLSREMYGIKQDEIITPKKK